MMSFPPAICLKNLISCYCTSSVGQPGVLHGLVVYKVVISSNYLTYKSSVLH